MSRPGAIPTGSGIQSITKTTVNLVFGRLAEEGRVDLDRGEGQAREQPRLRRPRERDAFDAACSAEVIRMAEAVTRPDA